MHDRIIRLWKRSVAEWVAVARDNWLIGLAVMGLAAMTTFESVEWLLRVLPETWLSGTRVHVLAFLVIAHLFPLFLSETSKLGSDHIRYRK